MKNDKEIGMTLIEALLAGAIFLVIITSIIGLLQIESNSLLWIWNDSYVQTAIGEAYYYANEISCEEINTLAKELKIKVGRRVIPIVIEKQAEEIISGKIRWTITLQAALSRKNIKREIIRQCP